MTKYPFFRLSRPLVLALAAIFFLAPTVYAAPIMTEQEIFLWPGTAPGSEKVMIKEKVEGSLDPAMPSRKISGITKPSLTAFVPAKPNGSAVLVIPGGGYTNIVFDKEGTDIAKWLVTLGVTAFVLKSRLPGEGHIDAKNVPLQDAQRAIRLIRKNASAWNLDSHKIGVAGFSAGGHQASMLGTNYDKPVYRSVDETDGMSARPDFMILAYPPTSGNARDHLVNPKQPPFSPIQKQELYDEYPTDLQITPQTPPTFIVSADDDSTVPTENSIRFYRGLKKADVPAELHIFAHGQHGFAIRQATGPIALWTVLCKNWLEQLRLFNN